MWKLLCREHGLPVSSSGAARGWPGEPLTSDDGWGRWCWLVTFKACLTLSFLSGFGPRGPLTGGLAFLFSLHFSACSVRQLFDRRAARSVPAALTDLRHHENARWPPKLTATQLFPWGYRLLSLSVAIIPLSSSFPMSKTTLQPLSQGSQSPFQAASTGITYV